MQHLHCVLFWEDCYSVSYHNNCSCNNQTKQSLISHLISTLGCGKSRFVAIKCFHWSNKQISDPELCTCLNCRENVDIEESERRMLTFQEIWKMLICKKIVQMLIFRRLKINWGMSKNIMMSEKFVMTREWQLELFTSPVHVLRIMSCSKI